MFKQIKGFWRDQRGALTTIEAIGYSVLVAGVVALVGYGLSAVARGKTADMFRAFKEMKAMSGAVTETSGYGSTLTTDTSTGIATSATGN